MGVCSKQIPIFSHFQAGLFFEASFNCRGPRRVGGHGEGSEGGPGRRVVGWQAGGHRFHQAGERASKDVANEMGGPRLRGSVNWTIGMKGSSTY